MFGFGKKKKQQEEIDRNLERMDDDYVPERMPTAKNSKERIEQHVIGRLEQMIEIAREIEDERSEYEKVSAYLADVERIEKMPEEEKLVLDETASSVVQLNNTRNEFLNSTKKISDAQFALLEQEERDVPNAINRLSGNELYRDTLNRDRKYLEREKDEWQLQREVLGRQQSRLRNLLYILIGTAAALAIIFFILQLGFEKDMYYAWMVLIFAVAVAAFVIFIKMQGCASDKAAAERILDRAISIENKVKIKYVNIANAIDYACEKYHVRNAKELEKAWEAYLEEVKAREKYERANEDLEYFNTRLTHILSKCELHDSKIWVNQAAALVDPKEMVEIRHSIVTRRQKLRERIDYNVSAVGKMELEVRALLTRLSGRNEQYEEILDGVHRLCAES